MYEMLLYYIQIIAITGITYCVNNVIVFIDDRYKGHGNMISEGG